MLCAGILYHLDYLDAATLVANIASVCERVAIIDTHISLTGSDSFTFQGRQYHGTRGEEHPTGATDDQVANSLWYSLDNRMHFAFTRDSLCNLLRHCGFTSVFESLVPYEAYHSTWPEPSADLVELPDRVTLIAVKGEVQRILSSPAVDTQPLLDRMGAVAGDRSPGSPGKNWSRRRPGSSACYRRVGLKRKASSDLLVGRARPTRQQCHPHRSMTAASVCFGSMPDGSFGWKADPSSSLSALTCECPADC